MLCICALLLFYPVQSDRIHLNVGGVDREALIVAPSAPTAAKAPVLFMFHGHGGSAERMFNRFHAERAWPSALVVYPDGLPIARGNPINNGNGWVLDCNESNRDVQLFDALLTRVVHDYHADASRVFAAGFSNGGMFMYTLWTMRANKIAGFCPSGAAFATDDVKLSVAKPCFVTISGDDDIVPASYQSQAMEAVRQTNRCASSGSAYGAHGTIYRGTQPMVVWNYNGGHEFPFECWPDLIRFFNSVSSS